MVIAIATSVTWGLALKVIDEDGIAKSDDVTRDMDYATDSSGFALPFTVFALWGIADVMVQCWCYWILGQISDSASELARYAGIYKATQSAGAAIAWKLNAVGVSAMPQLIVAWVFALIAVGTALPVAPTLEARPKVPSSPAEVAPLMKEDDAKVI